MSPKSLLIVEDDSVLRLALLKLIGRHVQQTVIEVAESVAIARNRIHGNEFDVILTDLQLEDGSGLELLQLSQKDTNPPHVIILTGHATIDSAVDALRHGAFDYIQKPYNEEHLVHRVAQAMETRRMKERIRDLSTLARGEYINAPFIEPVCRDARMKMILDMARRLANGTAPILLTGESGTGKEVLARFIHLNSPRSAHPFVAVNCAAIPETLLESELFGYEKGAFTGANSRRKGKFELAEGGTIFLDEIAELSPILQPKLLRVLDGNGFLRLGGQATIMADMRIMAATNRVIESDVSKGRFREDLFYRLNVGRLDIPPLRERKDDIIPIAESIFECLKRKYRRHGLEMSSSAKSELLGYSWPGNIRELHNVIERTVLLSDSEMNVLSTVDIPRSAGERGVWGVAPPAMPDGVRLLPFLETMECRLIQDALKLHGRNKASVARSLGLSKQLLNYKLKKYKLG